MAELITYRDAVARALKQEMARDDSVYLIGEDIAAAGGVFNLLGDPAHNHLVEVTGGCLAEESSVLLREFFRQRR